MSNSASSKKKADRKCFVPGCTSGYKSNKAKKTLFSTPKDEELFEKWNRAIPRKDKVLDKYSVVCEVHFDERFIERNWKHVVEGEEVLLPRAKPCLKDDAFPTIFPDLPKYLTRKLPSVRSTRNDVPAPPQSKKRKVSTMCETDSLDSDVALIDDDHDLSNLSIPIPPKWCKISKPDNKLHVYAYYDDFLFEDDIKKVMSLLSTPNKMVVVKQQLQSFSCSIYIHFKAIKTLDASTGDDIANILKTTESLSPCKGAGNVNEFKLSDTSSKRFDVYNEVLFSKNCCGSSCDSSRVFFCVHCKSARKRLLDIRSKAKACQPKIKSQLKYIRMRNRKLSQQVKVLKNEVNSLKKLSAKFHLSLNDKIKSLPPKQQLALAECFKASFRKSTNGMLFEREWLLECIIMRMKSPRLYEHLRINKVLILPSKSCIATYLRNFSQGFGFNSTLLSVLKEKVSTLDDFSRHGNLIFDELKLSENLHLKSDGKILGYVDYGLQTPEYLKNDICDHGLLLVFVPFTGKWTQILGVFATNKNMKADILAKTLIEAVIHAENAGLKVDCITGDGASWNRSMWSECGVGISSSGEVNHYVKHPCGNERNLYFLSDFPHLVKCVRNAFLKTGFLTPLGNVHSQFLEVAWKEDSKVPVALKIMPKVTKVHFHPNNFEKMRVSYAFQLFSLESVKGLTFYEEVVKCYGDSQPTIEFVNQMSVMITLMTSRCSKDALRINSWQEEKIREFHDFLKAWDRESGKIKKGFLSRSTYVGLLVTLSSTLSLSKYLSEDVGFKYLLTSRLSQDRVENLFGIVRSMKGCNDHPSPAEFLNIINSLSFYNLARSPVRGSNVETEVVSALISPPNSSKCPGSSQLQSAIDDLIDHGRLTEASKVLKHEFKCGISNEQIVYYISGYVVRKFLKHNDCQECISLLQTDAMNIKGTVTNFTREFDKGGLIYASKPVFELVSQLEKCFTSCLIDNELHRDIIFDVISSLDVSGYQPVGCKTHQVELTKRIIKFYLITRLHFYLKTVNKSGENKRDKLKHLKMRRCK